MAAATLPQRGLGAAPDRHSSGAGADLRATSADDSRRWAARKAGRPWAVLAVAAAHVLAVWVLTQLEGLRAVVRDVLPVSVVLLGPDRPQTLTPTPPAPPTPRKPETAPPPAAPRAAAPLEVPQVLLAAPTVPARAAVAEAPANASPDPAPTASPNPVTVSAVQPPPAPPAPATPPAPPPRKLLPATAVRYVVEPPFEVPRAARRAGEHGTVVLRVVISAAGLPIQVTVQRSSGYPRLDEQAVWAMRQARFQPYTEDGRALEVEALAPVEYPAE